MKVCPHEVFIVSGGKATIVSRDLCMECGACARNCQVNAIFVKSGVGCAAGILNGMLNNTEPVCGCAEKDHGCC
jgi:MinD superfamily P-loop ATPase